MSTLLTAKGIVEQALRKVGSYPINDSGADQTETEVGLAWLDFVMSELSGTEHINFLSSVTVPFTFTAGEQSYDLKTLSGTNWPKDGMAFPKSIFADDGSRYEITIITKDKFDALSPQDQSGVPVYAYIDRTTTPQIKIWPIPTTSAVTAEITFQTFSKTYVNNDNGETGLRNSWQRWAIYALATELGDGPIRRVPDAYLRRWGAIADATLQKLQNFDRSFDNETRITPYYG